jgi:hypothetical protein
MRTGLHLATVVLAGSLALVTPPLARASEVDGAVDAEVGSGLDTNPDRVLGAPSSSDLFLSGLVRGRLKVAGEENRYGLAAQWTEAGRLYASATGATALGSRLEATGFHALASRLTLGASLVASDLTERGHQLDQDLVDAVASIAWSPGAWRLHGGAGWNVFSPRAAALRPFLASGPRTVLGASWAVTSEQLLAVAWDFAAPSYPRWQEFAGTTRDDRTHTLSAELLHRGSIVAAAGYSYARNRSTAAGGAYDRHRVHARVATYLGPDLTLAARATLQWSSYPEPLYLEQQLLLSDGQQNLNSVEVRLALPLGDAVDLAFGMALYRDEATLGPGNSPSFTRMVATIGLGWRGQWSSITGTP